MKAITIDQPWASLVAVGAKRYLTMEWPTAYRGPIAVHAGLRDLVGELTSAQINAVFRAFAGTRHEVAHDRPGGGYDYVYPYGAVVATAELVGCWKIVRRDKYGAALLVNRPDRFTEKLVREPADELLFGDWEPGRYAWELADVKALDEPVPAKGRRGIWEWEGKR
jgi:hypothetical protein